MTALGDTVGCTAGGLVIGPRHWCFCFSDGASLPTALMLRYAPTYTLVLVKRVRWVARRSVVSF